MQILGKRSKILVIAVSIAMLVAIGVSFAMWDIGAVKATNGDLSEYANAKVGDIIKFGNYYQTGEKDPDDPTEYVKTPIEWLVVDKDERTGQLTLMSKLILASGSYFGNYYYNNTTNPALDAHYDSDVTIAGIAYNQSYVDSTARAFLNNLERLDMGGDSFDAINGYMPSAINSSYDKTENGVFIKGTGLLSSVGFSNQRYKTTLNSTVASVTDLLADSKTGLFKRKDVPTEVYYQRPITNDEYKNRPATRGFFDEAFNEIEKSMIVPKQIAGYTGHRWPDDVHNIATKSYVESAVDKVWLPSVTELNIMNGLDWNNQQNDAWANPSDDAGSTVFEYFKNYSNYTNAITNSINNSVADAVKTERTILAKNSFAMNYSIPVYQRASTIINVDIHDSMNSTDRYWTRSPSSPWPSTTRFVNSFGVFDVWATNRSHVGVRPCVILKY